MTDSGTIWRERAIGELRSAGLRKGQARLAVIDLLATQACALTAPEIESSLRGKGHRVGLASIWIRRGSSYIDRPSSYGREKNAAYFANDYHQPTDTARPDWDYAGMAEQVRFTYIVGYRLAMGE